MDPIKVKGIAKWPTPTLVKNVKSFLGFCNFYCIFILSFSHIAWPLNDLIKKIRQWFWGTDKETTFQSLKIICAKYSILYTLDWTWQFILKTDASRYALGAVLMQEFEDDIHPIIFNSHSLLSVERNYNAYDKELASMVFSFKCSCPFLLEATHTVWVHTDHKNL